MREPTMSHVSRQKIKTAEIQKSKNPKELQRPQCSLLSNHFVTNHYIMTQQVVMLVANPPIGIKQAISAHVRMSMAATH